MSVDVFRGETLALIGESGCGKSVTMKLMMALMPPSAGDVLWDNQSIVGLRESKLVERRLKFGYLFQGAALFDSMTVFENVAFGLRENRAMAETVIKENVEQRLTEVGLEPSIGTKMPSELSGGMRKRVGLARALALQPDVMFYDEPTTGLDPVMSDVINELILRIRASRPVTSVVVTHDMHTVKRVADRVVMFYPRARLQDHETQTIFDGTTDELFASDEPAIASFVQGDSSQRLAEMMSSSAAVSTEVAV
ncbi:UNVERIFIED_CONTAM: hypothetical protein GTU68_066090 [Idotea baltica]|nr:hypothetical protein [Idotea baltica]